MLDTDGASVVCTCGKLTSPGAPRFGRGRSWIVFQSLLEEEAILGKRKARVNSLPNLTTSPLEAGHFTSALSLPRGERWGGMVDPLFGYLARIGRLRLHLKVNSRVFVCLAHEPMNTHPHQML